MDVLIVESNTSLRRDVEAAVRQILSESRQIKITSTPDAAIACGLFITHGISFNLVICAETATENGDLGEIGNGLTIMNELRRTRSSPEIIILADSQEPELQLFRHVPRRPSRPEETVANLMKTLRTMYLSH